MILKINSTKLLELLENFYVLTGIRIVLFDDEFREIISYPANLGEFCSIVKQNPIFKKQCEKCDKNAFDNCKKTGQLQIYKCHTGLIDVAAPIKDNNIILGYIMFGQILDSEDKQTAFNMIESKLLHSKLEIDEFKEAFFKLSYKSNQQIKAAASIMEACACYLWLSELVSVKIERMLSKMDRYIESHLAEPFTIQDICETLQISRSKLYVISKQYYGMGISEYIKKKRLEKAKKLLMETELSIGEIAILIGISDYNYFYKVFKKETNISPGQFKSMNI